MEVIVLNIISFFILLLVGIVWYHFPRTSKGLPPGPKPLPVVGNLFELGDQPHKSLASLSREYGPVMRLRLGQVTAVVMSSSAAAKEVFQTHDKLFSDRPIPEATRACNHAKLGMPWMPASALWRRLRKICNSHLFSGKALDTNMNLRHTKVEDLISEVKKRGQTGEAVDIGDVAFKTSLNLMSTTLFSVDLGRSSLNGEEDEMAREIKNAMWSIMEEVGKTNVSDYFPLLKKLDPQGIKRRAAFHIKKFIDLFDVIVDQRLGVRDNKIISSSTRTENHNDLLDILIDLMTVNGKSENREDHDRLDRKLVDHLLLDLLLAGTQTTSSTLEWSMTELLRNRDILIKAQDEVSRVIGRGNRVKESDITRLPYLQSIVKEALRLHPPLPLVPRQAESDVKVLGYTIPKGSMVLINVWAVGRDPGVWGDNPEKFSPERFMGSNNNIIDVRARNYEFIPFGGGRRICPGLPMAMRMLHLMLGSLILSFDWKLEDGVSSETMNMDDMFGLSLQRVKPLRALPIVF